MPKPPTSVRSIRLQVEIWEWLQRDAEKRGITVNESVWRAISDYRWPNIAEPYAEQSKNPLKTAVAPEQAEAIIKNMDRVTLHHVQLHKPKAFNPQPKKPPK